MDTEWVLNEGLSNETKQYLFSELRKEFKTDEEAEDFLNVELRNSFVELIEYLNQR